MPLPWLLQQGPHWLKIMSGDCLVLMMMPVPTLPAWLLAPLFLFLKKKCHF